MVNSPLSKGPWFIPGVSAPNVKIDKLVQALFSYLVSTLLLLSPELKKPCTVFCLACKYHTMLGLIILIGRCDISLIHNLTFLLLVENSQTHFTTLYACKIIHKGITTVVTVVKHAQRVSKSRIYLITTR